MDGRRNSIGDREMVVIAIIRLSLASLDVLSTVRMHGSVATPLPMIYFGRKKNAIDASINYRDCRTCNNW